MSKVERRPGPRGRRSRRSTRRGRARPPAPRPPAAARPRRRGPRRRRRSPPGDRGRTRPRSPLGRPSPARPRRGRSRRRRRSPRRRPPGCGRADRVSPALPGPQLEARRPGGRRAGSPSAWRRSPTDLEAHELEGRLGHGGEATGPHTGDLAAAAAHHVGRAVDGHRPLVVVVVAGEHQVDGVTGRGSVRACPPPPGWSRCQPRGVGGVVEAHHLPLVRRRGERARRTSRAGRRTRGRRARARWSRGRRSPPARWWWCSSGRACRGGRARPRSPRGDASLWCRSPSWLPMASSKRTPASISGAIGSTNTSSNRSRILP